MPIPILEPLSVMTESVRVTELPEPAHLLILPPVPLPSSTELLSTFSHWSVAPCSTNTAQSPTAQSVTPSKSVVPATDTI